MDVRRERGFTLVELLVSVLIVGLAIVPMIHSFTIAWQFTLENQRIQKALMLAEWKMNQVRAENSFDELTSSSGNLNLSDPEYDNFTYEMNVVEGPEREFFEMKRIDLRIIFPSVRESGNRSIRCRDLDECGAWDRVTFVSDKELPSP